jgi:hypothetical protein
MYNVITKVTVGEHKGRTIIVQVVAENEWQAIDLAYYQKGVKKYQEDRSKYKAKRI